MPAAIDRPAPRPPTTRTETADETMPPAGPHAGPDLTNPDATPGAGVLPSEDNPGQKDVDSGAG